MTAGPLLMQVRAVQVRPPAVAGTFYPSDPVELRQSVDALVSAGPPRRRPKALVVPHAGYVYSGPVAGTAYASVKAAVGIRRVVLMGPSHFVALRGFALPDAEALETPLGEVRLDEQALRSLEGMPHVCSDAFAHAREHSLEVQLPFLQRCLGEFTVVPLAVGGASPELVGQVIDALWGGPETLLVISSDLSHYLPYQAASALDRETASRIVALGPALESERACGAVPVNGLLHTARARRLEAELLDLRNSGDTAGSKDSVVGYGAFAFYEATA